MMAIRKLPGTHKFQSMLVCNRCGYKVSFTLAGRSIMRDHLDAKHAQAGGGPDGTVEDAGR